MSLGGFSWKRFLGISAAKSRVSRKIGIPLTKSGRQRKIGALLSGGRRRKGSGGGCGVVLLIVAFIGWKGCSSIQLSSPEADRIVKLETNGNTDGVSEKPPITSASSSRETKPQLDIQHSQLAQEAESPSTMRPAPPSSVEQEKADTAPVFPESLKEMSLPVILTTVDQISLPNSAGKETVVPEHSDIKVINRSNLESLIVKANGNQFVGNETRFSGKVKFR